MKSVDISRLHELLHFVDGKLLWRVNRRGPVKAGDEAGCLKKNGYMRIVVDGTRLWMHRVVWAMHNDKWPDGEIDHINGVRHDNRIENLRCVTAAINQQNQKSLRRNKSGLLGVQKGCNRYYARINVSDKQINIGSFPTAEAAHAAYVAVKREVHPGCTI